MSAPNHARNALVALETLNALGEMTPNTDQRAKLAAWPGWGPLAPAFETRPKGGWIDVADRLEVMFTGREKDLVAAADSLDTAFYTPPLLVDAVFGILREIGFTGGSVLEPGCGSGRFISATPADMDIDWTGVEIDPTAATIAQALNPGATIINKPMQEVTFRSDQFDAVIGNVPFSQTTVFDPAYESASLHEYFLLRAIDAVRPGGYVIAITSRHTIDGENGLTRVLANSDFIGAVRLPAGAFTSEGTEVVTDILVLQRHIAGNPRRGWDNANENAAVYSSYRDTTRKLRISTPVIGNAYCNPVWVNRYWGEHPEHVAGEMRVTSYDRSPLTVISDSPIADIIGAVRAMTAHLLPMPSRDVAENTFGDLVLADPEGRKEGSFHLIDGATLQVSNGALVPVPHASAELRALIGLREAAVELVTLESDPHLPDSSIDGPRTHARGLYNAYVTQFGPLNRGVLHEGKVDPDTGAPSFSYRRPPQGGFRADPEYVSVLALEDYDQEKGEATAAPILLRRVNRVPPRATSADSPGEALSITLGEGLGVDLRRIGELLGETNAETITGLLADHVYLDPAKGSWALDRDYLSGNVRKKLRIAIAAHETNEAYARNVVALQAVLPDDLGPTEIRAQLGVPWATAEDITAFLLDTLGRGCPVKHTPIVATWEVDTDTWVSPAAALKWGTDRINPYKLVEDALNGRSTVIYDSKEVKGRTVKVRNNEATLAAEEKQRLLQERFGTWVWEDAARMKRICVEYNERFNSHVTRRHDGTHLTFPGMSESISLWKHQRDAVDRAVSSERTGIFHAVGSGKTLEMIAIALTLRRFGLANKPLIAVPNHLLEQVAREAQQAYPTARFLIAGREDLTADKRRLFAARCATGDWDAIVMTHQGLNSLPVSPETERLYLENEKAELRASLQEVGTMANGGSGRGPKQIARSIRALETRINELRHNANDDKAVLFDHLGVDYLAIDECHLFKRLSVGASRQSGFSMGASKRAADLHLKISVLAEKYPRKPVVGLFTGTPWSNTLAETYVWQKYLQPDRLEEAGVRQFDAWAANFVRYETRVEVTPDGSGFRMQRRPAAIQNFPEMRTMLGEVADLLPSESLDLKRPNSHYENVLVKPGPAQIAFVKQLAERADRLRQGGKPERPDGKGEDNMLVVCGDGRKVALDPVLVGLIERSPKVDEIARKVAGIYHATKDVAYGGTTGHLQLILCDMGTPHPDNAQTYGRVRSQLISLDVPPERVRFVHEAKTDKARAALFASCRAGAVSVLIGSTEKVGIGTNIQRRLRALHHLDAPWRPSDIEQREGRGLRPGNLNEDVDIYRYLTEGSFDGFMWNTLERKARFIVQVFRADSNLREVEDINDVVLSYGEVKALAAGNPLLLEQATIASEIKRLRVLGSLHTQAIKTVEQRAWWCDKTADAIAREVESWANALTRVAPTAPDENPYLRLAEGITMEGTRTVRVRGLQLAFRGINNGYGYTAKKAAEVVVRITDQGVELDSFLIAAKVVRRGPEKIAVVLESALEGWIAQAAPAVGKKRARVRDLRLEANDARKAAERERGLFEHAEALANAEAKLAHIESEIDGRATLVA